MRKFPDDIQWRELAMSRRRSTGALGGLTLLLASGMLAAQDVRFSDYHADEQKVPVVLLHAGGFRAVWASGFEFCSQADVTTRVLDLRGVPQTSDSLIYQSCALGSTNNEVAVLPGGQMMVVGGAGGGTDVFARVFDASGSPLTNDLSVAQIATATIFDLDVCMASSSSFAVVWNNTDSGDNGTYARIVAVDGSMQPIVTLVPPSSNFSLWPSLDRFPNGELLFVWLGGVSATWGIQMGQLFDPSLAPLSPAFPISQVMRGAPASVGIHDDRALVVWGMTVAGDVDVHGRWVDQTLGPQGSEFRINTYTPDGQAPTDVAADAQGRMVVLWNSYNQDAGSLGCYGQRFDASGNPWGPEFRINMTTWNPQRDPRIALLPSGDFAVVFWAGNGDNLDSDVFMRRFFFPLSLALGPGPDSTNDPQLSLSRPDGQPGPPPVTPYGGSGFGTTVGAGNFAGDALDDVLTGPGPGTTYGPQVRGFRSDLSAIAKVNFYAYATLRYGVKEGTAALDGDPYREILTTPGPGGVFGPHVRGFTYDNVLLQAMPKVSFFAFGTLRYGANGSSGELEGDGYDEMLVTPGPGAMFGAQLRGFDYDDTTVRSIAKINAYVFSGAFYGATVAASDIDSDGVGGYLDGYAEIACGMGPSMFNNSELRILDYGTRGLVLTPRYAVANPLPYPSNYGINVAAGDVDAGDTQEVATAPGPDPAAAARILCWEWNPMLGTNPLGPSLQTIGTDDFDAFPGQPFGGNVAIGTFE